MNTFIGVDLGWYGKPSGLASIRLEGSELRLHSIERLEAVAEILGWIQSEAGSGSAVRSLVIVAVAVGLWLRLSGHWSLVAGSALLLATLLPHSLLHATAPMQCECWHFVRTARVLSLSLLSTDTS